MLVGYAPFCSEDTQDVCIKIINYEKYLQVPPEIKLTKEAMDLMKRMISDPNKRLGKNGADEIKAHPFFKGIDWENIRNQLKPPFIPDIANDYDTKYFDTFDEVTPFYPPVKKIKRRKDMEYLGFTYKADSEYNIDKVYKNVVQIVDNLKAENEEKEEEKKEKANENATK